MKKLVKWAIWALGIMVSIGFITVLVLSSEKPDSTNTTDEALRVATNIEHALNKSAWDSLNVLGWTFAERHDYIYFKNENKAIISWENIEVRMNLDQKNGKVFVDGLELTDDEKDSIIEDAWSKWCNDSFWMFAPFKLKDHGTKLSLVTDEDSGQNGLLVEYNSGGVTPGDSYLWFYDENFRPTGYKMWVSIIPIGGTYASWDKWVTLPSGVQLSTSHEMKVFTLNLTNVKEGRNYSDFGFDSNPFE